MSHENYVKCLNTGGGLQLPFPCCTCDPNAMSLTLMINLNFTTFWADSDNKLMLLFSIFFFYFFFSKKRLRRLLA